MVELGSFIVAIGSIAGLLLWLLKGQYGTKAKIARLDRQLEEIRVQMRDSLHRGDIVKYNDLRRKRDRLFAEHRRLCG